MAPRVIVVDGVIAAGKTELVRALGEWLTARGYRVALILEPVDDWERIGILGKFYGEGPGRWGYSFQTYVYTSRIKAILEAVAAQPDADVYVLERAPPTDRVFMATSEAQMDPVELAMYSTWCDMHDRLLPWPLARATAVFIQPSLEVCMERLRARSRRSEVDGPGVSADYQRLLWEAHTAFFTGAPSCFRTLPRCPYGAVVPVDAALANLNWRDPSPERDAVVGEIARRCGLADRSPQCHRGDAPSQRQASPSPPLTWSADGAS